MTSTNPNQTTEFVEFAAKVAEKITLFNSGKREVTSQELEQIQHSAPAIELAFYYLSDETTKFNSYVMFFAANTLQAKIQSGSLPYDLKVEADLRSLLLSSRFDGPTMSSLCSAWVGYLLLNYSFDNELIQNKLAQLPSNTLINVLKILAEDVMSKKLYIKGSQRSKIVDHLISTQLPVILQGVIPQLYRSNQNTMFILQHWLRLARFTSAMRRGRKLRAYDQSASPSDPNTVQVRTVNCTFRHHLFLPFDVL